MCGSIRLKKNLNSMGRKRTKSLDKRQRIALYHGDNNKIISKIKSNSVDAVIIDPNYGINSKKIDLSEWLETLLVKDDYVRGGTGFNGNKWDADIPRLTHFEQLYQDLKPGGFLACFASALHEHYVKMTIESVGFKIKEPIMWIRTNGTFARNRKSGGGSNNLKILHEPIIIAQKPLNEKNIKNKKLAKYQTQKNKSPSGIPAGNLVYENDPNILKMLGVAQNSGHELPPFIAEQKPVNEKEYGLDLVNENARRRTAFRKNTTLGANKHDTVKPINLIRYLVRLLTKENAVVLDTFLGSGTTALACLLENRRFIGVELENDYFNISKIRTHTIYHRLIFLENKKASLDELRWHLDGLFFIKQVAKELRSSSEKINLINQMIGAVKKKIK